MCQQISKMLIKIQRQDRIGPIWHKLVANAILVACSCDEQILTKKSA